MKVNVVFSAHDFKFIKEIIYFFKKHPDFNVKIDPWGDQNDQEVKQRLRLLQWADVVIAEWCLANAVWYSEHISPHQKLFIRLHRHEMAKQFPSRLNIKNVNKIVFIAPYIQKKMIKQLKLPATKSLLIHNTVDMNRFKFKKIGASRYNIGLLGFCPKLKRLDKAITLFEKLKKTDDRYILHIKGKLPQELAWIWKNKEEQAYYNQLFAYIDESPFKQSILVEAWGEDVHLWFRKIGFILSTSDIEGSHQAVAEGMATGSIPIIHGNWKGSELLYPREFIKPNIDDAINTILSYSSNSEQYSTKQKEVFQYCKNNFQMDNICDQWLQMVLE